MSLSPAIAEKAQRLFEAGSVYLPADRPDRALVHGDTGYYVVTAEPDTLHCSCGAWRPWRWCSHCAAAALAWEEQRRAS